MRRAALRLEPLVGSALSARSPAPQAPIGLAGAVDGQVLAGVQSRGKHLLLHLADGQTVHSHLRMTGAWHRYEPGAAWARPERRAWLVIEAAGVELVQFDGPVLELLSAGRLALHPGLRRLGPDVLDPGFDPETAVARLRRLRLPTDEAGVALLDQSIAAGFGNIARCEALHRAGIHPFSPLRALTDSELATAFRAGSQVLAAGVHGELPRSVYGHRQCRRCGSRVQRRAHGDEGRTAHWCERCQPLAILPISLPAI